MDKYTLGDKFTGDLPSSGAPPPTAGEATVVDFEGNKTRVKTTTLLLLLTTLAIFTLKSVINVFLICNYFRAIKCMVKKNTEV